MNAVGWFRRRFRWQPHGSVRQLAWALVVLGMASITSAAVEVPNTATPPRLAFVDGEALFWRPGAGDDWEAAQVNIPLVAGDALATREGKFEVQIGRQSFVRVGDDSQIRVKSNEPSFLQLEMSNGRITVDARDLPHGETVEIDTASGTVSIARDGYYRVDVAAESTQVVVRRGGHALVTPIGGTAADVGTGEAIELAGTSAVRVTALAAPPFDDWDRWNYDRADQFLAAPRSYAVSSDVYGGEELEQSGTWRYTNSYGRVWTPSAVPAGWAPYTDGRWLWDPLYGWSWVDSAPWGWAPFHYGRWVYTGGYWGWAPGPVVPVPYYSPALVAFFGGPGFSVGIGVPFVSWVALGWGEPLIPWWGGVGFIGNPCWWGWGGPHVVNNVVINNNNVINANTVNIYRNMNAPGGVVGVPRNQFDSRSLNRVRVAGVNSDGLTPVHGALPVVSRSGAAGAPGTMAAKMPAPNLNAQRGAIDAQRNTAGSIPAFSRQAASGAQRVGAPPVASGSKPATSAFDALRNRGGAPQTTQPGANLRRSSAPAAGMANFGRGQTPPPIPGTNRTFDALRNRGAAPQTSPAGANLTRSSAPSAGATNLNRAQIPSAVPGAGRSVQSPPPVPGAATIHSMAGPITHLRSEAPPAGQFQRGGTMGAPPRVSMASPPALPRRVPESARAAAVHSAPSTRSIRAPGTASPVPFSSAPSFSRGEAPSFSRGGATAAPPRSFGGAPTVHAMPNFSRAIGGGRAGH